MSQSYITPVEDHDISVYLTCGGGVTKKGICNVSVGASLSTHSHVRSPGVEVRQRCRWQRRRGYDAKQVSL